MLVSIVIPCYNSEHTIGKVVELAIEEFKKLNDYECEFVLVNDYSRDGTWKSIHGLTEKYPNVWMMICRTILLRFRSFWIRWKKAMTLCLESLNKGNFPGLKI